MLNRDDREAFGRRLKAALVLADRTAKELEAEVGAELEIRLTTLQRVMQGKRAPRSWEIDRFAAALGVPRWFLEHGFEASESAGDDQTLEELRAVAEQIRALDRKLDTSSVVDRLAALEAEIRSLRADVARNE